MPDTNRGGAPEPARAALEAFLRLTAEAPGPTPGRSRPRPHLEVMATLRALSLFMLRGLAPRFFTDAGLGRLTTRAIRDVRHVSSAVGLDVPPTLGMSRIDAWYLRRAAGIEGSEPPADALGDYLLHLRQSGYPVHAWLIGEMSRQLGLRVALDFGDSPFRDAPLDARLYWLTHLFLLETGFLQRPLAMTPVWDSRAADLVSRVSWLIERGQVDLAAEAAVCLQLAGRGASIAHQRLSSFLCARQSPDGAVRSTKVGDDPAYERAHDTAAALLALAGAGEGQALPG